MMLKPKSCLLILLLALSWPVSAQLTPDKPGWKKFAVGSLEIFGIEAISSTVLYLSPSHFSNWPDKPWQYWGENLKRAYTKPPVWDHDHWAVNYLGHPYQGAYFFNSVRSQGSSFWTSAGMCVLHTLMWEYLIEAINEQPSINDLIVTPVSGILLGEGIHQLTIHWRKGGFTTWEKIGVALLNPLYVINNGLQ